MDALAGGQTDLGAGGDRIGATIGMYCHVGFIVNLQIQFSKPFGKLLSGNILFNPVQSILCGGQSSFGRSWDAMAHAAVHFQHFPGYAATAVAIANRYQEFVVECLLLVDFPSLGLCRRKDHAIVSGKAAALSQL